MSSHKKKLAFLIKKILDVAEEKRKEGKLPRFSAKINQKEYKDIDIAKVIRTFSDTLSDDDPQLEIIDVTDKEAESINRGDLNPSANKLEESDFRWIKTKYNRHIDKADRVRASREEFIARQNAQLREKIRKKLITTQIRTKYGTMVTWWDKDGEIRASGKYDRKQQLILNSIVESKSKYWQNPVIRKLLLDISLAIYQEIDKAFHQDPNLEMSTNSNYLWLINKYNVDSPFHQKALKLNCSRDVARAAEHTLREKLPEIKGLDDNKIYHNLSLFYPDYLVDNIFNILDDYDIKKDADLYCQICGEMMLAFPKQWRFIAYQIATSDEARAVETLLAVKENENILKIAGYLLKNDSPLLIKLAALYIRAEYGLKKSEEKLLHQLIPAENLAQFQQLVEQKLAINLQLLLQLKDLTAIKRKQVELKKGKIKKAAVDLEATVELVDDFIGEEELLAEEPVAESSLHSESEVQEQKQAQLITSFLEEILAKGKLSSAEVEVYAQQKSQTVNVFISDINELFYPILEDQLLLYNADYYQIDEFYLVDLADYLAENDNKE